MTVAELLAQGRETLETSGIDTAGLDASVLLAHCMGVSRAGLYARLRDSPDFQTEARFRSDLSRRLTGFPLAYLTGTKEFMGLEFKVDPRVLIPRPDTEILAEAAIKEISTRTAMVGTDAPSRPFRILDLCTGSGCLAVTLAHRYPHVEVWASDISPGALEVAQGNSAALAHSRVRFCQGDLFENLEGEFDLIVTNPPYLLPQDTRDCLAQGWQEPENALDGGGEDGLNLIRRLVPQAWDHLGSGGLLLLEAGPGQFMSLQQIFKDQGFQSIEVLPDLAGRDRVITGRKEAE